MKSRFIFIAAILSFALPLHAETGDTQLAKATIGTKDELDSDRHLIGTAGSFVGDREQNAICLNVTPQRNDGETPHSLTVMDVPVDGFWSVIVCDKDGFLAGPAESISVNNVSATNNGDGTTTIHFGGDPESTNYLRIMPGWTYMVRLYRPRAEILDRSWSFPTR